MRRFDQLDPQRKPRLAGDDAQPVEPRFVIVPTLAPSHPGDDVIHAARQIESCSVDQGIEQVRSPGKFVRQRRRQREAIGKQGKQSGPRLEQAEQVYGARQSGDKTLPAHDGCIGIWRSGNRRDQIRTDGFEGAESRGAAQRLIFPVGPTRDPIDQFCWHIAFGRIACQNVRRASRYGNPVLIEKCVETLGDRSRKLLHMLHQRCAVSQTMQVSDIIQRIACGKRMRLLVADHLQAVLDRAQAVVTFAERPRVFLADPAGGSQRIQCRPRASRSEGGVASTVDQLMGLGEELDLADAAATQLQIVAGLRNAGTAVLIANAVGQPADFIDRTEIKASAPHEGPDMVKKLFAGCNVASTGPRANESRPLPRQCRAFVMGDGGVQRNGKRAHFRCGAQAQIDPENVPLARHIGQQSHDFARIPLGRLSRLVAFAPWQLLGVVKQDRVDVGGIVKLARPVLAERQPYHSRRFGVRNTTVHGGVQRPIKRSIRKGRQLPHDFVEVERPGQIADRKHQGQAEPLVAQRACRTAFPYSLGSAQGRLAIPLGQQLGQFGPTLERAREEWCMGTGAVQR